MGIIQFVRFMLLVMRITQNVWYPPLRRTTKYLPSVKPHFGDMWVRLAAAQGDIRRCGGARLGGKDVLSLALDYIQTIRA